MTSPLDPKGQPEKPDVKQEQKPQSEAEKEKLSLGDILPLGSDPKLDILHAATHDGKHAEDKALNQFAGADLFDNQPVKAERTAINPDVGRFLNKEMTRDLSKGIAPGALKETPGTVKEFKFAPDIKLDPDKNIGGLGFGSGRQFMPARKSEFKSAEDDKSQADLRPKVDKFLTETAPKDEHKLTASQRKELTETRRQLADSSEPADIASNAAHLASLYQQLSYIEEARKALELSLGIDPEHMLGKEVFKELERVHPMDMGGTKVEAAAANKLSKAALRKRILNLSAGKVIVMGDLLIDELLEGKPERISREAPVLILEHVDTVLIPGGAANTAHNISALGGSCHAIGVCGFDDYSLKLAKLLESCGISHSLVEDPSRPTTVKTRILSKSHSLMQQLLRLDRISHERIGPATERDLIDSLKQVAPSYKAIVLSDYKAGVITDGVIQACREVAKKQDIMIIVDAQERFERFQEVTLMTPNQPDTERALGYALDSREALQKAGKEILSKTSARALLVTRGALGMVLFQQNQDMLELPVFNKSDVFDVTGAGDTVVATMALALVTGATFLEAMALGNLAAGIVVRKSGTAVTNQRELLENLELLNLSE